MAGGPGGLQAGAAQPGNEGGGAVGSWGQLGEMQASSGASMEDLIYIHWRKTRKTVYQKSYRAGSDQAQEREREGQRDRRIERGSRRKAGGGRGDAGGKGGAG